MQLVDSHAHLEQVENVEEALERAKAAGVVSVVAVSMDLASNQKILQLAASNAGFVYPALGIHPWAIEPPELERAFEFIRSGINECVAVGEIGLDYWLKKDKALQRDVFSKLLDIAVEHDKPVLTHSRGSYDDVLRMVTESGNRRAVFHWYSGPVELAEEIVRLGFFISATPAVGYSEKHRAVIERVPLNNLLLETDCPVKYNDIKSEPASVVKTLEEVAKLKGLDRNLVAEVTTRNCRALFGLTPEPD